MRKIKIWLMILWVCFWAPVLLAQSSELSEKEYLKRVAQSPLTFKISKEKSEEVWAKIQSWLVKYSPTKIRVVSEYTIETDEPVFDWIELDFGYSVSKVPMGEEIEISISCKASKKYKSAKEKAKRNAQILAHYVLTGELIDKFITK